MRFMTIVKGSESFRSGPPPALMSAIGEMAEAAMKDGRMVGMGGLMPTAHGAPVTLSDGKTCLVYGRFAESKEIIGGYAIFELSSKEEAIEWTRRFLELHIQHWPAWNGEVEVRQMAEGPGCGGEPTPA